MENAACIRYIAKQHGHAGAKRQCVLICSKQCESQAGAQVLASRSLMKVDPLPELLAPNGKTAAAGSGVRLPGCAAAQVCALAQKPCTSP